MEYKTPAPVKRARIGNAPEAPDPHSPSGRKAELSPPSKDMRRKTGHCLDCGTPFCHSGCPCKNLIPDWIELSHQNRWAKAIDVLHSTINFPEFTGRVCPAPCEASCVRDLQDEPVSIHEIETAIIDRAWSDGLIKPQLPASLSGKRVAIVGSGPAGLACAQQLTRAGHRVVVFEKNSKIGGLLRYGIPDFRLDKRHIDRRLRQMKAEGTVFCTDTHVGLDVTGRNLLTRFDALVLCCGSEQPRELKIAGKDLRGVHFAMEYLTQRNRIEAGEWIGQEPHITAHDKRVAVIGGGQTGVDCVSTANREGAASVMQIDHNPTPSADIDRHLTWPAPRSRFAIAPSHTHDAECRHLWSAQTRRLSGNADAVQTLHYAEVDIHHHSDGARTITQRPGSQKCLDADLVLLAMGFEHPVHHGLVRELGLVLDGRGNVEGKPPEFATNVANVFACGDVRRGQSLVVWAIHEGRRCARAVDRHLMGQSNLPN